MLRAALSVCVCEQVLIATVVCLCVCSFALRTLSYIRPSGLSSSVSGASLTPHPTCDCGRSASLTPVYALTPARVIIARQQQQQHSFNGPLSRTTRVSRYQKGKTNLDFTEARDSEWQRHQLGHMKVCTALQTDNHTSTPPLSFYRPDALPATQPTASKHWRQNVGYTTTYS